MSPIWFPGAEPYAQATSLPTFADMIDDWKIPKYRIGIVCWAISGATGLLGIGWCLGWALNDTLRERHERQ